MWNSSSLAIGLAIALLPLEAAVLGVARPAGAVDRLPATSYASTTSDSDLVCYMHTIDGRTLNLNRLCGSNANSSTGVTVSNMEAPIGNIGGLEVYRNAPGRPPCYGLDAEGRPCPPVQ